MSEDWANSIAEDFERRALLRKGPCLILGGADTGKTTLVSALGNKVAKSGAVAIVDADIGQSHIGPPTTVGWGVMEGTQSDVSEIGARGISFVGDVTPVGHLLQLTEAIVHCVEEASDVAEVILIDTPGFISGPAASALWWTVQRILKPELIIAVQRRDELCEVLAGLRFVGSVLEPLESPAQISTKSPQERRRYRQSRFNVYFDDSSRYNLTSSDVSIQAGRSSGGHSLVGRLVGLRDRKGQDVAVGVIDQWRDAQGVVVVKAPKLDVGRIRCLVIGDVRVDFGEG
ncbi:MAG: hypothetical protein KAY65_15115 [Planctomycetes bacterium]|nr:hypothetical protein [Planctomycetota bacterium]